MGGTFSKVSRPKLPGSYFDFEVAQPPLVPPVIGRQVAVCFTHTWGPLQEATVLNSLADFLDVFGGDPNNPSPGYIAVKTAFQGEGVPGFGGAGTVLAYRMGGSAAAKATKSLSNTTPAAALVLTADHEGTDGNNLKVTTRDHAGDSTKNELLLLYGTTVVETYVYSDTDITALAAEINANSAWVTATVSVSGVALAAVSASTFSAGNDGSTLVAGDYTDAMDDLEIHRFGYLAFENLTDSSILASLKTWAQGQNAAGRRFFTVVGGVLDEVMSDAATRSGTFDDPDFVNVGVGSVRDTFLIDSNGDAIILSSAQLAPRIAGILAYRGEEFSATFARLAGVELVNGPSAADLVTALDAGVIVLTRFSDAAASVRIEKSVTTYTTKTDPAKPLKIFSQPKYVATMHGVQQDLQQWADDEIVGKAVVNDTTRAAVLAEINSQMGERQRRGAVQPAWVAFVDPSPPPSDDDEFVAFVIGAKFGRSVEQVFFLARVS